MFRSTGVLFCRRRRAFCPPGKENTRQRDLGRDDMAEAKPAS